MVQGVSPMLCKLDPGWEGRSERGFDLRFFPRDLGLVSDDGRLGLCDEGWEDVFWAAMKDEQVGAECAET